MSTTLLKYEKPCFVFTTPSQNALNMARKADLKVIDRIVKEVGLSKTQRRLFHDEITKQNYSLQEMREIAEEIKRRYPNK